LRVVEKPLGAESAETKRFMYPSPDLENKMTPRRSLQTIAILAALSLLTGCLSLSLTAPRRSERMALETLIPAKKIWTTKKVLLVSVDGVIGDEPGDDFFSKPSTVVRVMDELKNAEKDPSIRTILLRVNSPGGPVTASDVLYREITRFKERTGKKVVAVFMDVAASGGYYAAMSADHIVAHPTTVTGSIGVIAVLPSLQGLIQKIGVEVQVVKSGDLKDMGSLWRAMNGKERRVLQNLIDTMYERFLTVVKEGRPNLDAEAIRKLADGRIYTAQEALDNGLIDEIGYVEDAFESAKAIAGISDASLVGYTYPASYRGNYYASTALGVPSDRSASAASSRSSGPSQFNLLNLDLNSPFSGARAPLYYLWMP
jgi:protease IV